MNKQLFEILDRMFPGEFEWHVLEHFPLGDFSHTESGVIFFPQIDLKESFWLADKVGLFHSYFLKKDDIYWYVRELRDDGIGLYRYLGDTPQEAICNAIVAIYGGKHD
jgi:hypothetical protein